MTSSFFTISSFFRAMKALQTEPQSVYPARCSSTERFLRWAVSDRVCVIVAILCLLVIILRMYAGGFLSLTNDEFGKAAMAWHGLKNPEIWFDHVWLPGHFPLIAAAYVMIDDILVASRVVSIPFGIIAIVGVYRLGCHLKADGVGGFAAILLATSPLVVWLSATGLVDILYVAIFILGFSYYVKWQQSGESQSLYSACLLLGLSCAFHYNAWLAGMTVGILISCDLFLDRTRNRLHGFLGLCVLGLVPVAWCTWNWLAHGDPLYFLHTHVEHSAAIYENLGASSPSVKNAIHHLASSILGLSPVLVVVTLASIPGVIYAQERQTLWRIWFVLLIFGGGLILLYARGGLPTAYPERYLLLPLVLMCVFSADGLSRLFRNEEQYVRLFSGIIFGLALITNVYLTLHFPLGHTRIQEAEEIADFLAQTETVQEGDKVLLEAKEWNHIVIGVFLNNPNLIIEAPHHLTGLLESEENARRYAQERDVRSIGVWSEAIRSDVELLSVSRIGQVGRYTFYNLR